MHLYIKCSQTICALVSLLCTSILPFSNPSQPHVGGAFFPVVRAVGCVLLLSTLMFLYCFLSACLVSMWFVDCVGWCFLSEPLPSFICAVSVSSARLHTCTPSECLSFVLCFNGGGSLASFSHTHISSFRCECVLKGHWKRFLCRSFFVVEISENQQRLKNWFGFPNIVTHYTSRSPVEMG